MQKIGIIGAGRMGLDIFNYLQEFDFELVLYVRNPSQCEELKKSFVSKLSRKLKYQIISEDAFAEKVRKTQFTCHIEPLQYADLVIESVTEDLETKKAVLQSLEKIVLPGTIVVSNTSSFLPSDIVKFYGFKTNFAGLHFFYPTKIRQYVEIIESPFTTSSTLKQIHDFCTQIDKKVILQDASTAFMLNKIALEIQNAAFLETQKYGLEFCQLDAIIKEIFPIGVFDFFDAVGLDVMHCSIKQYALQLQTDRFDKLIQLLQFKVESHTLGKKTNQGFYCYPETEILKDQTVDSTMANKILEHILNAYFCAAQHYVKQYGVDSQVLNNSMKDYFGMQNGPFDLIN